jgi:UDP-N-acetylglucosamine 1-carboxyvinyltransferase
VTARQLRGTTLRLSGPRGSTVTGTANVLCAATLARGKTVILGAAREPEIVDLGNALIAMGGRIEGLGTDVLEIDGVEALHGADHQIIPDRIETGTLLLAAAITGGDVKVTQSRPDHLSAVLDILSQTGMQIDCGTDWIRLQSGDLPRAINLVALPYPGIPTDLQSQLMALLSIARGRSVIRDEVFLDRFRHVAELRKFGAQISRQKNRALVRGAELHGARVTSSDLRASAALILAALAASKRSIIERIDHLDRGYEHLDRKLQSLGANIRRLRPSTRPYTLSETARSFSK